MKLNELAEGAAFRLERSGAKYIKGPQLRRGPKSTTRFVVYPLDAFGRPGVATDLSLQCQVKPLMRLKEQQ